MVPRAAKDLQDWAASGAAIEASKAEFSASMPTHRTPHSCAWYRHRQPHAATVGRRSRVAASFDWNAHEPCRRPQHPGRR